MSAQNKYYLFLPPETVVGPHSFDRLREWVAVGALSPDSQVCISGTDAWFKFTDLPRHDSLPATVQRRIETRRSGTKSPWYAEPGSDAQIKKLRFFGIPFETANLTRARASELIDCFVAIHPNRDEEYRNQPASDAQKQELQSFGIAADALSHSEAKALIYEARYKQQQELEDHDIDLMLLDNMVNDEDVLEICHYRKISDSDLERLLMYLKHDLPDWRKMGRFDLGEYVARRIVKQL